MNSGSPETVATFDNAILAHIARSQLESHGILARLDGEFHVNMDWLAANAVGGVKVLVAKEHLAEAKLVLADNEPMANQTRRLDKLTQSPCPKCGSLDTRHNRLNRKLAFVSLLILGIPIPIVSNKSACNQCAHRWAPHRGR